MDNNKPETFSYVYSAKEQQEIKNIRDKYCPQPEDKMAQLRRLDASVTKNATIAALIVGCIGALILGLGMSLAMTVLGSSFGMSGDASMIAGIIIGVAGIILVSAAYPLYNCIVRKNRRKIAPEIIRLTDELMK